MAAFNDIVTTTITIDGKQAVNQIGALEMEVNLFKVFYFREIVRKLRILTSFG
jgi:hypothetical protein